MSVETIAVVALLVVCIVVTVTAVLALWRAQADVRRLQGRVAQLDEENSRLRCILATIVRDTTVRRASRRRRPIIAGPVVP